MSFSRHAGNLSRTRVVGPETMHRTVMSSGEVLPLSLTITSGCLGYTLFKFEAPDGKQRASDALDTECVQT